MQKPPNDLVEPHQRLRWARLQRGFLTASDAARAMNMPIPTYSGHDNGTTPIPRDQALKYARFFLIRVGWLLDGEGSPTSSHDAPAQELFDSIPDRNRPEAVRFMEYLRDRGDK